MNEHEEAEFEDEVRREVFDKMESSLAAITIWGGTSDVKLALETGAAVLMDKPIIVVTTRTAPIPRKLRLVAEKIVRGDLTDDVDKRRMAEAVARFLTQVRARQSSDGD